MEQTCNAELKLYVERGMQFLQREKPASIVFVGSGWDRATAFNDEAKKMVQAIDPATKMDGRALGAALRATFDSAHAKLGYQMTGPGDLSPSLRSKSMALFLSGEK